MKTNCIPILAMIALLCTGCWPKHIVASPGVFGMVRDRQTRAPVNGATVVVSRVWRREWPNYGTPTLDEALEDTRPPLVVTGANGRFFIPPQKKWMWDFPMSDEPAQGTLIVRHDGYEPSLVPLMDDPQSYSRSVFLVPSAR